VAQSQGRYDEFAEWYQQWIGDAPPLIAAHASLLPAVAGDRVLDIACGQGRMSRYLARLGAEVVGVDISAAMLGKARAADPETITYIHADVTAHPAWWDGRVDPPGRNRPGGCERSCCLPGSPGNVGGDDVCGVPVQ
jgi:SAM-dependent methyltransferase